MIELLAEDKKYSDYNDFKKYPDLWYFYEFIKILWSCW